jgi:hypothetical protein
MVANGRPALCKSDANRPQAAPGADGYSRACKTGAFGPSRPVQGFHTPDEGKLLGTRPQASSLGD